MMKDPRIYLEQDRAYHIDMLNALADEKTQILYSEDDGVLLRMNGEGPLALSAKTEEALRKMIEPLKEFDGVMRPFKFLPLFSEKFGKLDTMVCHQVSYTAGKFLEEPEVSGVSFKPLTMEHFPFIMREYGDDEGYMKSRIEAGMIGAFNEKDECVGFIGMHGEGSVGILKVIPQYRRMGIAAALEARMINNRLAAGQIPFAHVVVGNYRSVALQKKMGMEIAEKLVTWLWPPEEK